MIASAATRKQSSSSVFEVLVLLVLYAGIAWYCYPFFFDSLTNNDREIATYNSDSQTILNLVNDSLGSRLFEVNFFDYGHFYFNVALALSYVYSLFFPLDDWTTFFILRLTSWLGMGLSLALVCLFARRFLGSIEAAFAACLFALSPAVVEWGIEVHPDSWQMFFLTLSLYFCGRAVAPLAAAGAAKAHRKQQDRFGFVMAAAAAAGAAFGTKYLGILLLPLLIAAVLITPVGERARRTLASKERWIALFLGVAAVVLLVVAYATTSLRLVSTFPTWGSLDHASLARVVSLIRLSCLLGGGLSTMLVVLYLAGFDSPAYRAGLLMIVRLAAVFVAFIAVFALISPWSIYGLQFVPSVVMQSVRTGLGDQFGLQWLPYVFGSFSYDGDLVGWETGAFATLGAALLVLSLLRRDLGGAHVPLLFVLGFVIIFMTFLVTHVNRVSPNYALPAVPGLVLLAASALSDLRVMAGKWIGPRVATAAAVALATVVAGTQVLHGVNRLIVYRNSSLVIALAPDNRMLGDWLLRCVAPDARIYAAPYSYVPPQFQHFVMGESRRQLASFDPDVVTFNQDDRAGFERSAAAFAADPYVGDMADIFGFFDEVTQSPRWRMGPRFDRYQIYVALPARATLRAGCL